MAIKIQGNIVISDLRAVSCASVTSTGDIIAFSSDYRLKENLNVIENALEKIEKISGYTFDWKDNVDELGLNVENKKDHVGLIAQEVKEILPQVVQLAPFDRTIDDKNISKSGESYLTVQYEKLVPLLVQAIKELKQEINNLKSIN